MELTYGNISVYCDMTVNSFSEVHKLPGNQCGLVAMGVVMSHHRSHCHSHV